MQNKLKAENKENDGQFFFFTLNVTKLRWGSSKLSRGVEKAEI